MDADFFKTEKEISVFENTWLCVDCQIGFKVATCVSRYFINTEKKISVFENARQRRDVSAGRVLFIIETIGYQAVLCSDEVPILNKQLSEGSNFRVQYTTLED